MGTKKGQVRKTARRAYVGPRKPQYEFTSMKDGGWTIVRTPKGLRYFKKGRIARLSPRAFGGKGWPLKIWK